MCLSQTNASLFTEYLGTSTRVPSSSAANTLFRFFTQIPHSSGHRGWIINTASMLGLVGLKPGASAYCASKGAVVLLTKQIAVEYASDKVHCNALCPGCEY